MKKYIPLFLFFISFSSLAQDSTKAVLSSKERRRQEKQSRLSTISRQEEEGVLNFRKQSALGLQLRTNGYGIFYEIGRTVSPRRTNLYSIEIDEIRQQKEFKEQQTNGVFGNSYIFGKINNFYPVRLGYGQQYLLGNKGNKNGIAVMGIYQGGLSVGLLRPYYLRIDDRGERDIKYDSPDSTLFLDESVIIGSSGLGKGWNEIKIKPGAFVKTAMRFDFGRFNDMVQAVEIGLSVEGYAQKIQIMAPTFRGFPAVEPKQIFFQAHLAFLFGRRK